MPTATATAKKAAPVPKRVGRKPAPKATFQEPLPELKEQDPTRPQEHKGIPVDREEPIPSNLPGKLTIKISRLHLADGTTAYACRDCLATGDTRAEVMGHRNQAHNTRYGKKTPRVIFPKDPEGPDLVLPERKDGALPPNNIMEWTLAELLAMVPSIEAFGDLIDRSEAECAAAKAELEERRGDAAKAAVYESLHEEVLDLRLAIRSTGTYEQLRAEVLELRAWKKKIIARFSSLGFKLEEDH